MKNLEIFTDIYENKLKDPGLKTEEREVYKRLCNFKIQRSLIKKAVMTIPYNASNPKLIDNVTEMLTCWYDEEGKDWYKESEYSTNKLSYKDLSTLIIGIKNSINIIVPKVTSLIKYLKEIAYITSVLNISIAGHYHQY